MRLRGSALIATLAATACVRSVRPESSVDATVVDAVRADASSPESHAETNRDAMRPDVADNDASIDVLRDPFDALEALDALETITPTTVPPLAPSCIPDDVDAGYHGGYEPDADRLALDPMPTFDPADCPWPIARTMTATGPTSSGDAGTIACSPDAGTRCTRRVVAFRARERTVVTLEGDSDFEPSLSLRTHCDDPATAIPLSRMHIGDIARYRREARVEVGAYYLVVDSNWYASPYASFNVPAPNYGCGTPTEVSLCTPIVPEPGVGESTYDSDCDVDTGSFVRVVSYRVNMPPDSVLHIVGASPGGCGVPLHSWPYLGPFAGGPVTFGLDSRRAPMYFEALPAAPNRTCNASALLTDGARVEQIAGTSVSRRGEGWCDRLWTLFYVFDIPPHTSAMFATSDYVGLNSGDSCSSLTRLSAAVSTRTIFVNDGESPRRRFVSIDDRFPSAITAGIVLHARADASPNAACATPMLLSPGVSVTAQTFDRSYEPCAQCPMYTHEPALFYRIHLEPMQRGHVTFSRTIDAFGPINCGTADAPSLTAPVFPVANDAAGATEFEFAVIGSPTAPPLDVVFELD